MKTLLLLVLFLGAFLVMDGAHRDALRTAVREAEERGRGKARYLLPEEGDLLGLQFAPRSDHHGSIFSSAGPWAFRDEGAQVGKGGGDGPRYRGRAPGKGPGSWDSGALQRPGPLERGAGALEEEFLEASARNYRPASSTPGEGV